MGVPPCMETPTSWWIGNPRGSHGVPLGSPTLPQVLVHIAQSLLGIDLVQLMERTKKWPQGENKKNTA